MADDGAGMTITLAQLRVLEALARTGSFSKAAEALGVSQPSVSLQVRNFESRYKARLVVRDGHDLRLSRLGEALLPKIRSVLALAGEIDAALAAERDLLAGALRIGYSTHQFVMPILSRFMRAHPGVRIEARSMASYDLVDLLRRGALEAAFVTLPAVEPDLDVVVLRREEIVLMAPAAHPLAAAACASWEDVARLPLIRREPSSGTRRVFDAAAAAAGIAPRIALDLGSWESMRSAVVAGIGFGIAMRGEIGTDHAVAAVRIADGALQATHALLTAPDMREAAGVAALQRVADEWRAATEAGDAES